MTDNGYVIKDISKNEYFCGCNIWDAQLRKAKIYHSILYTNNVISDSRFKNRNLIPIRVEIKECDD